MLTEMDQRYINRIIVKIDTLIAKQLNVVMHHHKFKELESSWCGLYYLVNQAAENYLSRIKIKVLNVSWVDLARDLARAVEFDQSQLFAKVYNNEFGHPGGEPFGILVGDYYVSHKNFFPRNDVDTLRSIAKVAAAAFVPFIVAAAPSLLGLNDFSELDHEFNLELMLQQAEYQLWKGLRADDESRFLGLVLPQVLMRLPYNEQNALHYPFVFEEKISATEDYLWGNAGYCFAAVVFRSFGKSGWFTDIRGMHKDSLAGAVTHLPMMKHKPQVNAIITDQQEKKVSDQGLIPLCFVPQTNSLFFYSCSSLQSVKDQKITAMLHYILCISRFSHYIKVIARDKMGSFASPEECEKYLQNWLRQYTASSANLSYELKAKYPLRAAKVEVKKRPGSVGSYLCTIQISPHYQFDRVQAYLELSTEFLAQF